MFIETSAKTKIGVQEAFEELVNKVNRKVLLVQIVESPLIKDISLEEKRRNINN